MSRELKNELLERILAGDRRSATALVEEWAEDHGYERAVTEILEPALTLFGDRWATEDDVSLAQGYIAGKVAEDIMERAAASQAVKSPVSESKGQVVIGNIEDDCHVLGRRMVATFLRLAGWEVYDLGEDVLAAAFVDKALEVGAPIVGASAMMYRTALNIKKLRKEIDDRGLSGQIQLAVGGAVFIQRPELVKEVGGDGTARNAIAAPALMEQLLEKVPQEGGTR